MAQPPHHGSIGAAASRTGELLKPSLSKALARKIAAEDDFTVRAIKTESELMEQWEIDKEEYKDGAAPYEKLSEWWQNYPNGIFVLLKNNEELGKDEIVGAVGIFPVSRTWIDDFRNGKVDERSLTGAVIEEGARGLCDNWYITGVVLRSKYRTKKNLGAKILAPLIRESIINWVIDSNRKHPVTLWAIALSREGETLLKKFDFTVDRVASLMIDKKTLYRKVVSQQDIRDAINRLKTESAQESDADETPEESEGADPTKPDHLVILVHGINTWAHWMPALKRTLEEAGFAVAPTSYGRYGVRRFLSKNPDPRKIAIDSVADHIRIARRAHERATGRPPKHMSVISHSFGTYVMSEILVNGEFKWRRVIFCGSVVRNDFPFGRAQDHFENPLLNEVGTKDYWPAIAESAGWDYGSVGSNGLNHPLVDTRWHNGFRHSDFLTPKFCKEHWIPFLQTGKFSPGDQATNMPLWIRAFARLPLRRWKAVVVSIVVCTIGYLLILGKI